MRNALPSTNQVHSAMLEIREKIDLEKPAYRQITQLLREQIQSKKLVSGTRLPPIKHLADLLGTNYFTVQSALIPLVNEGLLITRQRRGTYVSEASANVRALGIYFGSNMWTQENRFFQELLSSLLMETSKQSIIGQVFIDTRATKENSTPFEPLVKAADNSEINAVVAAMLAPNNIPWLNALPVPCSMLYGGIKAPNILASDEEQFFVTSLQRLKALGCTKVGLIGKFTDEAVNQFVRPEAQKLGLVILDSWICLLTSCSVAVDFEKFGYEQFKELWSQQDRPDGLIAGPDILTRGVVMAILEKGVRIPENLKIIFHGNLEIPMHCPFPVDWQYFSVKKVAESMVLLAKELVAGKTSPSAKIQYILKPWESA